MFCPKCGIQNPETGKFCRSCGTDLGNVSNALSGKLPTDQSCFNSNGKPISLESAATKFFMGIAFVIVAVVLAVTGKGGGWWFWMLIPAFMMLGTGAAQYVQLRNFERGRQRFTAESDNVISGSAPNASLPSPKTTFVAPESRYKTGDLVPPSVTDSTTRHLEINSEGETVSLPKR